MAISISVPTNGNGTSTTDGSSFATGTLNLSSALRGPAEPKDAPKAKE